MGGDGSAQTDASDIEEKWQWQIQLPPGRYRCTVLLGDASHSSVNSLLVNSVVVCSRLSLQASEFAERSVVVETDGGVTVTSWNSEH